MNDTDLARANLLLQQGRRHEAVGCFESYLKTHPQSAEAWHNLGVTFSQMRRYNDAVPAFDRALAICPESAQTWSNRGNALVEQRRFDEAVRDFDRALAIDPQIPNVRGYRLLAKLWCCDWDGLEEEKRTIAQGLRAGERVIQPFGNLMISGDPAEQLQCARIWTQGRTPVALWRGERYAHDKIRVAYLSGDFRTHPVAILMAGVLEHHDASLFETVAVSFGPGDRSDLRNRIASSVGRFIDVRGKTDFETAGLLRELEIDIAVDLMGLTGECRSGILAHRAAPVQVNYVGFPGTMAMPEMDYLLADETVIPKDEQRHYTEKIVYLPHSYLPADSKRRVGKSLKRAEAGLPEKGFVFAAFNNSYKIAPAVFGVWMRLLSAIDGSVIWLSQANPAAERNLRQEAAKYGVDPDRLVFAPFLNSIDDHLARVALADLFLDTLPCNAHTTASDALWVGLPVLTARGSTFAGRVAASLLHAVGLDALITPSLADYEALALRLARNPHELASLRARLQDNRESFPLFDTARFARHLEAAYRGMWERCRKGSAPESFAVPA